MTKCADCRDGEHENYSPEVDFVIVGDPTSNELIKKAWMCTDHQEMYLMDGYTVSPYGNNWR
jgi:hypothetical protein